MARPCTSVDGAFPAGGNDGVFFIALKVSCINIYRTCLPRFLNFRLFVNSVIQNISGVKIMRVKRDIFVL
jgi:hypothetical protein